MEQVDGDEDKIPGDAGIKRIADDDEIGDLEGEADDRGDPQPYETAMIIYEMWPAASPHGKPNQNAPLFRGRLPTPRW
jgi:hypothetical protein